MYAKNIYYRKNEQQRREAAVHAYMPTARPTLSVPSQTFTTTLYPLVFMTASVPINGSVPAPMLVMYWLAL